MENTFFVWKFPLSFAPARTLKEVKVGITTVRLLGSEFELNKTYMQLMPFHCFFPLQSLTPQTCASSKGYPPELKRSWGGGGESPVVSGMEGI